MKHPQPMAMEINETNYDIAVACLPGGFGNIDKENVLGHMLVINELQVKHYFRNESDRPSELRIANAWMKRKRFKTLYKFIGTPKLNTFTPIEDND